LMIFTVLYNFCCFLGQLNDSRIEKADPSKGDTIKSDINNDTEGTFIYFFIFYCLLHNLTSADIISCALCFIYARREI